MHYPHRVNPALRTLHTKQIAPLAQKAVDLLNQKNALGLTELGSSLGKEPRKQIGVILGKSNIAGSAAGGIPPLIHKVFFPVTKELQEVDFELSLEKVERNHPGQRYYSVGTRNYYVATISVTYPNLEAVKRSSAQEKGFFFGHKEFQLYINYE